MDTRTAGRAVLGNLRTWWPEMITGAILTAIALAGQKDDVLFAVLEAIIVGIGWAMGFRHRHRPIFEVIRRMDAKLDVALEEDDRPLAEVRQLHSV